MNKETEPITYTDIMKEEDQEWLTSAFLMHTHTDNYLGDYSFSLEEGFQLDWGKYGYDVDEAIQGEDYSMLVKAARKFNDKYIGRYIAIAEYIDKYNCIHIMDLQQLANQPYWIEELRGDTSPAVTKAFSIIATVQKHTNGGK